MRNGLDKGCISCLIFSQRTSAYSAVNLLYNYLPQSTQRKTIPCGNGHVFEFKEYRHKGLLTVLGSVALKRAYYYDKECRAGQCPKDKALGVEGTSFSPGMRRIMGRVGAYRAFGLGACDIKEMAGIYVDAKEIERVSNSLGEEAEEFYKHIDNLALSDKIVPIHEVPVMYICMDGTGVPVVKYNVSEIVCSWMGVGRSTEIGCVSPPGFGIKPAGGRQYARGEKA